MSGASDELETLLLTSLSPLPGHLPCGEDARADVGPQSLYYRLRDARSHARIEDRRAETESASEATATATVGPWREVLALARDALATETKDIEIAAWLFEALVRVDGLAGFTVGARIVAGLLRSFWGAGLHPAPDDDDPWSTLVTLRGLSGDDRVGTLVQPLRTTTILSLDGDVPVSSWSYGYAREVSAIPAEKRAVARVPDNLPDFKEIERFARGAGAKQLAASTDSAALALAAWAELDAAVSATGSPPLSTSQVKDVLSGIGEIAGRYVRNTTPQSAAPVGTASPRGATSGGTDHGRPEGTALQGTVEAIAMEDAGPYSREALLDQVLAIAAVFRTREPNAFISFTLEEAVRRARLPMTDLFAELIPDERARGVLLVSLGLRVDGDYVSLATVGERVRRTEPPPLRRQEESASRAAESDVAEDDPDLEGLPKVFPGRQR